MTVLVGLSYSPWTHKARWALEHHGIRYRYFEHTPMAGEPLLRMAARRLSGRVSVPILLDGVAVVQDSMRIARHAESFGSGTPLFPAGQDAAIHQWNELSERVLGLGRGLVTIRLAEDPAALAEAVPGPLRAVLGPLAVPIARMGNGFVQRKYRVDRGRRDALVEEIRECFDELRAGLAKGKGDALLAPGFTYADVTMAVTLQLLEPIDALGNRLGPATRGTWANPELARDYPDLLQWRERLYRARSLRD